MSQTKLGILAIISACIIWGLSPLYYKSIGHVPPMEVLSHRTIWSFILFFSVIVFQGRVRDLLNLLKNRSTRKMIILSTLMVSANWFLFIWAIQAERTLETSLGYFIQPLVAVALGFFFLREVLRPVQWFAILLAACGVMILILGAGFFPWLSLVLAVTFGFYGLIKKRMEQGAVLTVTAEVLLFAPISLVLLFGAHTYGWTAGSGGQAGVFGTSLRDSLLLALSGLMTAGPLILFSYGARRVSLATTGLTQYLNPTLQFLLATLVFAEPFTRHHATSFAIIWVALLVYSASAIRQQRRAARVAAIG